jgi:hypothetical protein
MEEMHEAKVLEEQTLGEMQHGGLRMGWEGNIKTNLRELDYQHEKPM